MVDCLTEESILEFREAFALYDKDGDGTITVQELGGVLRSLGLSLDLLEELDGYTIDFPEFLTRMACMIRMQNQDREEDLIDPFRKFDLMGTGLISPAELVCVLAGLGERLTDAELDELIREADPLNDGNIRYEEFVRKMMAS